LIINAKNGSCKIDLKKKEDFKFNDVPNVENPEKTEIEFEEVKEELDSIDEQ